MKRKSVVLLVALIVILTLVGGIVPMGTTTSAAGQVALARLQQDAVGEIEIVWNTQTNTPSFVSGTIPVTSVSLQADASAEEIALDFARTYADLFRLQQVDRELVIAASERDELGMDHVTLQQLYHGIPVHNAIMRVHIQDQTIMAAANGVVPDLWLTATQPTVSATEALAIAQAVAPGGQAVNPPALVVYTGDNYLPLPQGKLVWLVDLSRPDGPPARYVVDATEPFLLNIIERLHTRLPVNDTLSKTGNAFSTDRRDRTTSTLILNDLPPIPTNTPIADTPPAELTIIGGSRVEGNEFPWIVRLKDDHRELCTGSLVAPDWVLTAAHCLDDIRLPLQVFVGGLNSKTMKPNGFYVTVKESFIHPRYTKDHTDIESIDIALLRLESPVDTSQPNISTIPLITPEQANTLIQDGSTTVTLAGWGRTQTNPDRYTDDLLKVDVLVYSCFDGTMLCAAGTDTKKGACFGDSGGPLFVQSDNNFLLVGVIRTGDTGDDNRCPTTGNRVISHRVIDVADWVEAHIKLLDSYPPIATYDSEGHKQLPSIPVRIADQVAVGQSEVDNAHNFTRETFDYFRNVHGRNSFDDQGALMRSTVNYGTNYVNAFWEGLNLYTAYGTGLAVKDVVAHEWTHAVTQHTANLEYRWQSGALNESFSDIFAAMVDRDNWLIGEDIPSRLLGGADAMRSLSHPEDYGQPWHTDEWKRTCSNNEGVHTNSGITNHAYYLIATDIGKDKAEQIFYRALTTYLQPKSSLRDARAAALSAATDLYERDGDEYRAVDRGFRSVGITNSWNPPGNNCSCAATQVLAERSLFADALQALDIAVTLYQVRDQLLDSESLGQHYRTLYEEHSARIGSLLANETTLRTQAAHLLRSTQPGLQSLVDPDMADEIVTEQDVRDVTAFLQDLAHNDREQDGGELAQTIEQELQHTDLQKLVGMTYAQAWESLNSRAYTLYMPMIVH